MGGGLVAGERRSDFQVSECSKPNNENSQATALQNRHSAEEAEPARSGTGGAVKGVLQRGT